MGAKKRKRPPLSPLFTEALQCAAHLHASQLRKGPDQIPYVSHLMAVASLVLEHGGSETQAIAALLHDAVEDQPRGGHTEQEIRQRFGEDVLRIVQACTDSLEGSDDRSAATWRPRKKGYIAHLGELADDERLVSLADKVHNARAIVNDLRRVGSRVWERFKVGRHDTLWYYRSLVDAFMEHEPAALVMELESAVGEMTWLAGAAGGKAVYVPSKGPHDWRPLLASPLGHWKPGRSAHTIAHAWERAAEDRGGVPGEIASVITQHPAFRSPELLLAIPEHKVPLPGGRTASQNDVWALVRAGSHVLSVAVEGKVAEPFDETVEEWLKDVSSDRSGKPQRLDYLCEQLGIAEESVKRIRYQLLHRTASAIIEAERFGADHAVMLVHSFDEGHTGFEDFEAFARLFGLEAAVGKLLSVPGRKNPELHLGWVAG